VAEALRGGVQQSSGITRKTVEDFHNTLDFLGTARNLGQQDDGRVQVLYIYIYIYIYIYEYIYIYIHVYNFMLT
jgi:hypothetical protein